MKRPEPFVSVVAIMQDEAHYVDRWLNGLAWVGEFSPCFDELVVLDGGSSDETVERLRAKGVTTEFREFEDDFAAQRNAVEDLATHDWVFHLDADEVPSLGLLHGLSDIVANLEEAGMNSLGLPRLNFIDQKLQAGPGHLGLDYQYRLKRRRLLWVGRVHEEVHGRVSKCTRACARRCGTTSARCCGCAEARLVEGHFIIHDKRSDRHRERNALFDEIAGGVAR